MYKYTLTKRHNRQQKFHQSGFQYGLKVNIIPMFVAFWSCGIKCQAHIKTAGFTGTINSNTKSCDSVGTIRTLPNVPRSWGISQYIQILSDSCFCSWFGITQLALHHYSTGWDPRRCSLTRTQQPPSCLSSESSHKTQAVSLPLRIRLHLYHTLLAWLMKREFLSQYRKDIWSCMNVETKRVSRNMKWKMNIYGVAQELKKV